MPRLFSTLLASLALVLALAPAAFGAASKAPKHTVVTAHFALAHPSAGRLCESVAAGRVPPGLQASASQLGAACTDLKTAYDAAKTQLDADVAPLRAQLLAARTQALSDCAAARQAHDKAACRAALRTFKLSVRATEAQLRAAVAKYRAAVRAADSTFFGTVRSLGSGS